MDAEPEKTELPAPDSAARRLLDHVWRSSNQVGKHSWTCLNDAMRAALNLAISARMVFDLGDFAYIAKNFKPEYWMYDEDVYGLAIRAYNTSAYYAYEHWRGRKPFIIDGHRVFVGYEFSWNEEQVVCTSMNDKEGCITVCHYDHRKVVRRYRITHAAIRERNKARKEA